MITLHHAIYEDQDASPVLVHVIPAESREAAIHILNVHAKYDAFLRAAMFVGAFNGMKLRIETVWT